MEFDTCDENIMFDPRLQEYMKKKIYYKKNNINPCISLELEYNITHEDLEKIKKYYKPNNKKPFPNDPNHHKFKIMYKQQIHNEPLKKCPYNNLQHSPITEPVINKINKYKEKPIFLIGHLCTDVLDSNENKNLNCKYNGFTIPNKIPNSNRSYTHNECVDKIKQKYKDDQFINLNNDKNMIPILLDMQLGMPQHTSKSYGYDNPNEHYFDYIDEDIQDPNHIILPFPQGGFATRNNNKSQHKPYTREVT
jgi:hypothetical protein